MSSIQQMMRRYWNLTRFRQKANIATCLLLLKASHTMNPAVNFGTDTLSEAVNETAVYTAKTSLAYGCKGAALN